MAIAAELITIGKKSKNWLTVNEVSFYQNYMTYGEDQLSLTRPIRMLVEMYYTQSPEFTSLNLRVAHLASGLQFEVQ